MPILVMFVLVTALLNFRFSNFYGVADMSVCWYVTSIEFWRISQLQK